MDEEEITRIVKTIENERLKVLKGLNDLIGGVTWQVNEIVKSFGNSLKAEDELTKHNLIKGKDILEKQKLVLEEIKKLDIKTKKLTEKTPDSLENNF